VYAKGITLINSTLQPVTLTENASGCSVKSRGDVTDEGTANTVVKIDN